MTLRILPLLLLGTTCQAQFSLEHTYPNGGTGSDPNNELYMAEFETIDPQYVLFDRASNQVSLMDLDHALVANYDLTVAPAPPNTLGYDVLYISQHLFDLDDGIELMVIVYSQNTTHTSILDDDGTVMHTFSDEWPRINLNVPQEQRSIYNTPAGTKLILSSAISTYANVYSLPGTLTTGMAPSPGVHGSAATVRVFPNPTSGFLHVECSSSSFGRGELVITDATGSVVLRRSIVLATQSLDVGHFAAGEYTYAIMHADSPFASGRFVKQ